MAYPAGGDFLLRMNHEKTSVVEKSSKKHSLFQKYRPIDKYMKNLLSLILALLAVITLLYAGLNGLVQDHSYGTFFTFVGALTTVGLGIDVVNHLKIQIRKNNVRKLGRL